MIVLSFYFVVVVACENIPAGTVYAVWVGLGAVGVVLMGIIFFNETAGWKRILFLFFIIAATVGLKVLD